MYPNYKTMSEDEKRWRRRDDARTLAQAEEIKADKERLAEAHKGAKEILEEEASRLRGLSKVAHNQTVDTVVKKEAKKQNNGSNPSSFKRTRTVRENPATVGKLF